MSNLALLIVSASINKLPIIWQHGKLHTSPNSGYPEAALAFILNCRFGGPNSYFGKMVNKPYIGLNDKSLDESDLGRALRVNLLSEWLMGSLILLTLIVLLLN